MGNTGVDTRQTASSVSSGVTVKFHPPSQPNDWAVLTLECMATCVTLVVARPPYMCVRWYAVGCNAPLVCTQRTEQPGRHWYFPIHRSQRCRIISQHTILWSPSASPYMRLTRVLHTHRLARLRTPGSVMWEPCRRHRT